jgi:predicted DNA-binding mobile mystery protein A
MLLTYILTLLFFCYPKRELYSIFVSSKPNNMRKSKIQIEQLEDKMVLMNNWRQIAIPPTGWAKAIRSALGMTLQQVANRMGITKPSVHELEKRESQGTVTIRSLRSLASALDMQLVYGFVPKDGSLDELIDRKAEELARKIVERTSTTMSLEDQENSKSRLQKALTDRKIQLKTDLPKALWD